MLYLLNSPILTNWGLTNFQPLSPIEAGEMVANNPFTSAIGHASSANLLSAILEIDVPTNRVNITMQPGDVAIVLRMKPGARLEEGKVLSKEELEKIPYELGLLEYLNPEEYQGCQN